MRLDALRHLASSGRLTRWLSLFDRLPLGRRFEGGLGQLGVMQRWYAAQPTQRVVVSVLELEELTTACAVEQATRKLCAQQPGALGVCLERTPRRLRVRPLTEADPVPLETASGGALWPFAETLAHRPFGSGAPLFRLMLTADRRHVLCAFDHLIADGVAAAHFARELARSLAGLTPSVMTEDAELPLDARLDLRPTTAKIVGALREGETGSLLLTPPDVHGGAQLRTRIAAQQFERVMVDNLLLQARAHAVTLHAVLSSAALLAAHEALDAQPSTLRLHTPISLRDLCQPRPTGMGVFICGVDTDCALSGDDDHWTLARQTLRELRRQRPGAHRKLGLLAFASDLGELAQKYERRPFGRTATVEVSNVGRVDGLPDGTAVWLTQGVHYHAASFVLTVATSDSDGALRCCLSYPEPLISETRAERFQQAFHAGLQRMAAG